MFILTILYSETFLPYFTVRLLFLFKSLPSKIELLCNGILYEPSEREINKQFLTNAYLKKVKRKFLLEYDVI